MEPESTPCKHLNPYTISSALNNILKLFYNIMLNKAIMYVLTFLSICEIFKVKNYFFDIYYYRSKNALLNDGHIEIVW